MRWLTLIRTPSMLTVCSLLLVLCPVRDAFADGVYSYLRRLLNGDAFRGTMRYDYSDHRDVPGAEWMFALLASDTTGVSSVEASHA